MFLSMIKIISVFRTMYRLNGVFIIEKKYIYIIYFGIVFRYFNFMSCSPVPSLKNGINTRLSEHAQWKIAIVLGFGTYILRLIGNCSWPKKYLTYGAIKTGDTTFFHYVGTYRLLLYIWECFFGSSGMSLKKSIPSNYRVSSSCLSGVILIFE